MKFPRINPTLTETWKKLSHHFDEIKDSHMLDMFSENTSKRKGMDIDWKDVHLDYSKNRITDTTIHLLLELANEVQLKSAIEAQFSGEKINETENRSVGHTHLRDFDAMKPEVSSVLLKMKNFSQKIITGEWKGHTGKPITTVVNIGIGGSDLGPDMVCGALQFYKNHLDVYFISNVDGDHVGETLKKIDRETTLFIIASKTFTTQETMTNAHTVREWFLEKASETDIDKHFVAISTNIATVIDFGIDPKNIFPLWDWVGGRFSLWSAVGLSISCAIGYDNFEELLKGGHEADQHFKNSDFKENIPVILGLLSVWYTNFFEAESECVMPYSQYLNKLVPYLQQAVMESNGKSVDRSGNPIEYQTGSIVWGSTGTNAQHAFLQHHHQGTKLIPTDFIAFTDSLYGHKDHQNKLLANCFAQTEALLQGTHGIDIQSKYKVFKGNQPSNTILIKKLTPKSLGKLIAMYEHKIFVQGVIWNIFSYDQWGVELGKEIAKKTLNALKTENTSTLDNVSTKKLADKAVGKMG